MDSPYIETNGGFYRIRGTRVSLDSVVYAYWDGLTPEGIAQAFPSVTLEQAYGAITFYLANRAVVDASLKENEHNYEAQREAARQRDPDFYANLAAARRNIQSPV